MAGVPYNDVFFFSFSVKYLRFIDLSSRKPGTKGYFLFLFVPKSFFGNPALFLIIRFTRFSSLPKLKSSNL